MGKTPSPTDPPLTYEYATVRTHRQLEPLYRDTYASFGWALDGYGLPVANLAAVDLRLKRPRRLNNRAQVIELQRTAERALAEIGRLERVKTTAAMATSLSIGIVGAAAVAGAVLAIEADLWLLSVLLGALGLLAWLAGYLAYGRVAARRTTSVTPQIDHAYDVVYEASEQAAHLLVKGGPSCSPVPL